MKSLFQIIIGVIFVGLRSSVAFNDQFNIMTVEYVNRHIDEFNGRYALIYGILKNACLNESVVNGCLDSPRKKNFVLENYEYANNGTANKYIFIPYSKDNNLTSRMVNRKIIIFGKVTKECNILPKFSDNIMPILISTDAKIVNIQVIILN